ncbi:type I secretion C-terminal target domain-containing protein [Desulfovibrio sp. OttesenSCG-928-M16]|nr:type I secretion C-terminal target domain-containing protein [Desulfovibrio sp. OttesenSCG-928-M16]
MIVGAGTGGPKVEVNGLEFDNVLQGGDKDDVIIGGLGNNLLVGGDGNDYIQGGTGNDIIYGGKGDNILFGGGGGADLFVWTVDDLDGGYNRIMDFSFSEGDKLGFADLIDVSQGFDDLLTHISISATALDQNRLTLQVEKDGSHIDVDLTFRNNELQSFIDNHLAEHGNSADLDQALLNQIIQNITG